ncbi:MAG: carboxypeptidase regulatory-like domain-containing protein [Gemmatimonadales bacterium]
MPFIPTLLVGARPLASARQPALMLLVLVLIVALTGCQVVRASGEPGPADIAGTVQGANGPEAGVWVIAETRDLPTPFAKIVVTDDQGRYLLPELPDANYRVWVRGYGLIDSPTVEARPGATLDLRAVVAPDPRAAAQYYPAGYWFSLMRVPGQHEFPGTGPEGNGISPNVQNQAQWLRVVKSNGCQACHQLGGEATRLLPPGQADFASTIDAWDHRILAGQAGFQMSNGLNQLGRTRALEMFADWTDRIVAGEVPPTPPRPQGIERNVVITMWDWADPKAYLHDVVSTDRRNPTVNAYGPVYGALELSADYVPVLDPRTHTASRIPLQPRDSATPRPSPNLGAPSPYWGEEVLWTSQTNVHNPMIDAEGRVWLTARVRPPANPPVCREGSSHPSAQVFPNNGAGRHLAVYDPRNEEVTMIGTCFGTHHLMFAEDANSTLWTSGGGQVIGWLDTKCFDETGDEEQCQGWTPLILDTNGNGVRDDFVNPNDPFDPTKDTRVTSGFYAVAPAPDGSIWGTSIGYPGTILRLVPGSDPSRTALVEVFQPPLDGNGAPVEGFSPRGGDVDRNGVYWAAMASGHLASFDRRKCTGPLNGPTATGQHCPEGWTFYTEPLPQMHGVETTGSAEGSYYTWVDQFNTSGLGENVPINTGNQSEALLALVNEEWVILRVPYPLGFYTKWLDGRIDDPRAGWKGRGLWATVSTRAPFHMEGGKGSTSKVVKFQVRPDPLAR